MLCYLTGTPSLEMASMGAAYIVDLERSTIYLTWWTCALYWFRERDRGVQCKVLGVGSGILMVSPPVV